MKNEIISRRILRGKMYIILFVLLLLPNIVFAEDGGKFNIGYFGFSWNTNTESPSTGDMEIDLINFGLEFDTGLGYTQLGVELSLLKFWITSNGNGDYTNINNRCSLLNLGIYLNLFGFKIFKDNVVNFALFNKINYIHVANEVVFKWNEFIYSAGIRSVIAYDNFYNLFCIEAGYRNATGRSGFYFSVNLDMGVLFLLYIMGKSDKE